MIIEIINVHKVMLSISQ